MDLPRRTFLSTLAAGAAALPLAGPLNAAAAKMKPPRLPVPTPGAEARAHYLHNHNWVYFNTGGLGPMTFQAADKEREVQELTRGAPDTGRSWFDHCRAPVASFLGAHAEEVCFTRNATEGNSTIATGLDLQAGDEVIFESHAHPGGSFAWLNEVRRRGVVVRVFEPHPNDANLNLERIMALFSPKTKVVQVSHITAPTGIRMPVDEIATLTRERGIWFHIDGAQSAGMLPLNLHAIGCDSFATCGHKWIGGPQGTGILYIRKDRLEDVHLTETGAHSAAEYRFPDHLVLEPGARRFEAGTRDPAKIAGLAAAVEWLQSVGQEAVFHHDLELARQLKEGLGRLGGVRMISPTNPDLSSGMVSFQLERLPFDEVFGRLLEHGFRCRPVAEEGINAVRISLHVFTSPEEVDSVLKAIHSLV